MPRQRLADGRYELSANPGLHNVAESTRGKTSTHKIGVGVNGQEDDTRPAV